MVNVGIDISVLIAGIACIVAIAGWVQTGRKSAVAEGKHLQEVADLKKELSGVKTQVQVVQECYQTNDGDIREIKADMTWVKEALGEIKLAIAGIAR